MDQVQEAKQKRMTTQPVGRLVCSMAVPTIISMLISSVYNMADTYFVGKLHDISATGAVGVVFSFMAVIQAVGFFFGHGSGNYISRQLGKNHAENAETMAATGFIWSFVCGFLVMAAGFLFQDKIVWALQATETIYPYAMEYLTYILIASPFMCGALVLNNQLRFQGSAFYGMIGITSGGILNMLLDPLFIFTFRLGVAGAAGATMISQMVSFFVLLIMVNKSDAIKIKIKKFSFSFRWLKEIFRGGIPSLCRQGIGSVSTMCLNAGAGYVGVVMGTGDAPITAMTVVTKVVYFASSALIGFGQGFQPVCGYNYGAGLYGRVKKAFWFCVKTSSAVLLLFSVAGIIFAPQLIAFFQKEPEVVSFGAVSLRYQCFTFALSGWIVICNMMQQTMGKAVRASILALSRQGLMFIPLVLILPRVIGPLGLQIAQPIADILTFLIAIPLQVSILKEMKEEKLRQAAA